jgi:L-aspartate oxidase
MAAGTTHSSRFLVVGSGIAGLSFALDAARSGPVTVLTKKGISDSASAVAQGGIAAVLGEKDSVESHVQDTLRAGAGLCREDIVRVTVSEGPERVRELEKLGVAFSQRDEGEGGGLDLGREGGHSIRRIAHVADTTGRSVMDVLMARVHENPAIQVIDKTMAIDLIVPSKFGGEERCVGCYALDLRTGLVHTFLASCTLLATGGAGKVYLYTSNPDVASGDGVAMGYRAGALVANMEFFQFHPTCLYHPRAKSFLVSEALRGEGAILRLLSGRAFMEDYHDDRDLAPRDIVARAIDSELKRSGDDNVLLDITHRDADFVRRRFPFIHERCLHFGVDITRDPIPVVPAAHYHCGGLMTDEHGRTTLQGLWAVGECACNGLHGANRLASNSLLEGLVYSRRAALNAAAVVDELGVGAVSVPVWDPGSATHSEEEVVVAQDWDEIRRFMWNYVGIVRTDQRLERARRRLHLVEEEIREYYWNYHVTGDLLELRNLATVAGLIIESAIFRRESRGLHYNADCPEPGDEWRGETVVRWGIDPRLERFD